MTKHRKVVRLSPILIALFVCAISTPNESRSDAYTPNYRMSIVTWNLQYRTTPVSSSPCCDSVPDRAKQVVNKILDQDIDVLAINEAFDDEISNALTEILPDNGYEHFVKYIDGKSGGKFEVSSVSQIENIISGRTVIGGSGISPFGVMGSGRFIHCNAFTKYGDIALR